MLREGSVPTTPHEHTQDPLEEEATTPLSEVRSVTDDTDHNKLEVEVLLATKRLLESIRLRDFQAYE
jgi:hypothetical protein